MKAEPYQKITVPGFYAFNMNPLNLKQIGLFNINNILLSSESLEIKSIGFSTYNEKTKKFSNQNLQKYNKKNNKKKTSEGCLKGCAYTSLLVLMLGLFITII